MAKSNTNQPYNLNLSHLGRGTAGSTRSCQPAVNAGLHSRPEDPRPQVIDPSDPLTRFRRPHVSLSGWFFSIKVKAKLEMYKNPPKTRLCP